MADGVTTELGIPVANVVAILKSQYRAGLAMLRDAVERCPDELWIDTSTKTAYWHIAYHALFYTHLYLHQDEKDFQPWVKHKKDHQFLGPLPWPPHDIPKIDAPYTKAEILDYALVCESAVEAMHRLDLTAPQCGFWWYKVSTLEHQFINLRHLQHHVAQLIDRLGHATGQSVKWVGAKQAE